MSLVNRRISDFCYLFVVVFWLCGSCNDTHKSCSYHCTLNFMHTVSDLYCPYHQSDPVPGPLPLGVAVIDSSVRLYGLVFPHVAYKHRYQMLQHFIECIKQAKSQRQQAVQINIFTAVLCALKVSF